MATNPDGTLRDLKINKDFVRFECPLPDCSHMQCVPFGPAWYEGRALGYIWTLTGEFPNITLSPSVHNPVDHDGYGCGAHYFILDGKAVIC